MQLVAIQARRRKRKVAALSPFPQLYKPPFELSLKSDMRSNDLIVAQDARLRESAMAQQDLSLQASRFGLQLTQAFSTTALGASMPFPAKVNPATTMLLRL